MTHVKRSVVASVVLVGGLSLVIGSTRTVSAQSDSSIGTWKLNVAKSKYVPGPAPKTNMVTMVAAGKGIKVTTKGTGADGKPTATGYTANYDGKDVPVTGGDGYDTVSLKRIDANTVESTRKMAGKVVQTLKSVVSADGKTRTTTTTGTDDKGRKINNVAVFEKQ
jgi:hypothetical protein